MDLLKNSSIRAVDDFSLKFYEVYIGWLIIFNEKTVYKDVC